MGCLSHAAAEIAVLSAAPRSLTVSHCPSQIWPHPLLHPLPSNIHPAQLALTLHQQQGPFFLKVALLPVPVQAFPLLVVGRWLHSLRGRVGRRPWRVPCTAQSFGRSSAQSMVKAWCRIICAWWRPFETKLEHIQHAMGSSAKLGVRQSESILDLHGP